MGCCMSYGNRVEPVEDETALQRNFKGPVKERKCRDVIFIFIFVAFLAGLGYVIFRSALLGNPYRLWYGVDSWGNVCNVKNAPIDGVANSGRNLEGKKDLFYFTKNDLVSTSNGVPHNESVRLCIRQCPNGTISTIDDVKVYAMVLDVHLCRYDVSPLVYTAGAANGRGSCPPLPIEGSMSLFHRCVPRSVYQSVSSAGRIFTKFLNLIDQDFDVKCAESLEKSWREMCYILCASIAVPLVLLVLLRFFAGVFVWLTVVLMALGCLASTGVCWYMYSRERTTAWLAGAIVVSVVTVIVLLILLVLRSRLALVVKLFREAGKAVAAMPLLLLQPFLTLLILGFCMAGLVYAFLYLITSKNPSVDESTGFVTLQDDQAMKGLIAYMLLAMLWVGQLIVDSERLSVSSAVAIWYFTRDKSQLSWPIAAGIKRTIAYHLGSVIFGSLIIALVSLVRIIVSFIEGRLSGAENAVAKCCLKCFGCCLWCFENCLKFLNNNAYVMIAIRGDSFCGAARAALKLIVNNALRLAAINCVGDFVLFLCKAANVAIVAVIGLEVFKSRTDVPYTWLPITLSCVAAYFLASIFMGLFEMCIDAIFICFCEDCEQNDGEIRPYFMSKSLMKLVNDSSAAREAKAAADKQAKQQRKP